MPDMEYTTENVEKLASDIVESWDLNDLIQYAVTQLTNHYMENEKEFHEECSDIYGEI